MEGIELEPVNGHTLGQLVADREEALAKSKHAIQRIIAWVMGLHSGVLPEPIQKARKELCESATEYATLCPGLVPAPVHETSPPVPPHSPRPLQTA